MKRKMKGNFDSRNSHVNVFPGQADKRLTLAYSIIGAFIYNH